jgi:metal-sulfur cluster biosynthetic enzyme
MTPGQAQVLEALGTVIDPELDEPITSLGFVASLAVSAGGDVDVQLRLPTPQCAPNFAFLMVSDAWKAIRAVPGARAVHVVLDDHYTGAEINAAVDGGGAFSDAFPGETAGPDLEALRELFQRKALIARQSNLCEALLGAGADAEEIVGLCVADLEDGPELRRCLELREQLGIAADAGAPAFVSPNGEALAAGDVQRWLRMARLIRTSLETNGGICRSLLEFRHELASDPKELAR